MSYIPQNQRKKILFIADDIRTTSGVAGMAREIVLGCAKHFNFVCIGGSIKHPENGKQLDLSQDVNKHIGIDDAYVRLYPTDGYGSPELIKALVDHEKVDAIMMFTDPRYYIWLFQIENELRSKVPFIYLNIWDDLPAPLYNEPYYESCDALLAISKQTENINKLVLGDKAKNKIIKYVPHGINTNIFFPIGDTHPKFKELTEFKKNLLGDKKYDFVLLYNARNIRRKSTSDLMVAFKLFCDRIGKDKASKVALVLHTQPVDEHGTNLIAVRDLIDENENLNIIFNDAPYSVEQMNLLYNSVDTVTLVSSNEGWGLSLTEGLVTGKMIIAGVTGGMQDQMRFEDKDGNWIKFDSEFCSNHFGTFKKCGIWAEPVFPNNMSMVGSPLTPYIWDDRMDFRDITKAIENVYNLSPEERKRRGEEGLKWATSDEAGFTAEKMCIRSQEAIDQLFTTWKPRPKFEFIKIQEYPKKKIKHKLVY